MSPKILLVGSSGMELTVNVKRLADAGEVLRDDGGITYSPGGRGACAAVTLAKLGADAVFVTRLGADLYGQKLYNFYKESGVNTAFIKVDRECPTGFSMKINEASGKSRTMVFPGANEKLGQDAVIEAFSASPNLAFINFESSFEVARRTAEMARERNIPIFIDASPANANFPLDTLPQAEVFSVGEEEAFRYTGIKPTGTQEALRCALNLSRKIRAKYIVVNLGDRGSVIYDGKRCEVAGVPAIEKCIDKSAANDAFSAALCVEYQRCGDIKAAARYAEAAYLITASRFGTTTAVPTDKEVRERISKLKF